MNRNNKIFMLIAVMSVCLWFSGCGSQHDGKQNNNTDVAELTIQNLRDYCVDEGGKISILLQRRTIPYTATDWMVQRTENIVFPQMMLTRCSLRSTERKTAGHCQICVLQAESCMYTGKIREH